MGRMSQLKSPNMIKSFIVELLKLSRVDSIESQ